MGDATGAREEGAGISELALGVLGWLQVRAIFSSAASPSIALL